MAGSKSSQTTRNIIIACLALWSIISLIIIVVWATSPDMKSASQCRAELQTTMEKLKGSKVIWEENKVALENIVEETRANITMLQMDLAQLSDLLASTNVTLNDCKQENVLLNENITTLEKEIELHKEQTANLTAEITLREDHIELLNNNVTQSHFQTEACMSLNTAAESLRAAAETQNKACQARKKYLDDQLNKCKMTNEVTCPVVDQHTSVQDVKNAATPHRSILLLAVVPFASLHLLT